ncbi:MULTISPECIES: M3 family metallopeptidase [Sorangium]|uniref:oligopeptidase A n=1 Tax=Sorangium cellulosum TaxID=56 RepID=A0A4P2R2P8_SORCE|nr:MULTISPECIES: M3 family metallopeptidase [Sorangium]AUX36263.1 oligopeptidase A [Sorangium cellulosum]WCQ95564.1 Oligopeptidase A [Sorangium sp. Soce836]
MTEATDNPLLSLGFEIPFDRIRSEHVEPAVRALLADARARLEALIATPGPRTYDNTLAALEAVTERLDRAMNVVSHLESTSTTPELRAAYNAVQPEVSEFLSGIALNEGVYGALKAFAATPEAGSLTGPRRRFFKKTLDDFRRSGAELDPPGKKRLSEIDVELATLTLRFSQNVLDATNAFEFVVEDPARLAGLPPSAVEAARQSAQDKGVKGYRFTLQAPSYIPVLTHLDDASIRERFYRAYNTRATEGDHDNRPLIRRILELRREKAALLGYATFADLVLEDRMAKTGAEARRFVATLRERTEPVFAREKEELAAFRREIEGPGAPPLEPWDVSYYAEKLRRARYDFDDEALRPYFPLDRVVSGLFEIAHRLYGVRIVPWQDAPAWHPSVRAYRLLEADGAQSAAFYLDFTPREQKRDGAWMHGLVTGAPSDGGRAAGEDARHLEVLAGSFTPPVGGRPALLNHREVETLFHEFGHMMHHASSRVPIRSLAGTNVAWDFVELPSQIMENWCWEREALDLFARHHETGAPIPDDLLQRMRAARTFRAGAVTMRQLGFAEIDLALHVDWTPERGDVVEFAREVLARYSPVPLPEGYAMIAGFSHLFSSPVGYAAGYYSYKWAEVLDADAFSRFQEEGLFSRKVGDAFRSQILALGDTQDPMDLYKSFRGREPTLDALLQRSGLA